MSSNRAIRLAASAAFFVVAGPMSPASTQVTAQSVQHGVRGGGGTDW
ncbi:hypothetical protein LZ318_22815 [Saccharopolyspora indica]|nr:hypothetical protein [Saccharopolyspora indica]MDA3650033.1 hypothetical protein [Saccharopolyspora indica]